MKRLVLIVSFVSWALFTKAQLTNEPYWIHNHPISSNATYYYRVTIGEGIDYDKAYANAFAKAIQESSWKLGVKVNNTDDLNSIVSGTYHSFIIEENTMNIAMNKVCEYVERLQTRTGLRVFVLWQVASSGKVPPVFDEFNECE